MIQDFDQAEVPAPGHADVCVVGSGAIGILIATELAAAGRRVTLLEGGGLRQEPTSQELYRSEVSGVPVHRGIHMGRFRTYGGSTTQWGGQILELDEFDFEKRAHVDGSGWPFPKSTLTEHYERALRFAGLRRVERDDEKVRRSLGLSPRDPGAEFVLRYSRWCPERNFAVLHGRELASTRRLSVYVHASVVGFDLNDAGTAIARARVKGSSGREAAVTADRFVICLGGIESTRLLLQPMEGRTAPWQTNGLLGRHYQDHIALDGIPIKQVAWQPASKYFGTVMVKGFNYHTKIQMRLAEQVAAKSLNVAGNIVPLRGPSPDKDRARMALRDVVRKRKWPGTEEGLNIARHLPSISAQMVSQRMQREDAAWKETMLRVDCEQLPRGASTISLSAERDRLGMLRTKLHWDIAAEEFHTIRAYVRLASRVFPTKGLGQIEPPKGFWEDDGVIRAMMNDSSHHMGGTRMSVSASEGIVDPDLKLHGIENGYVCGSSVFPCSGFSNPTHTALALAMRLSDKLLAETQAPVEASRAMLPPPVASTPMRTVTVPGVSRPITQLGFGCAYLLGPGLDRDTSRRLLDAAYDAGIKHFDVARLYGAGKTEAFLGEFLQEHRDATVTTKYGVVPPNTAWRVVQTAQRQVPGLKRTTKYLRRNEKARFDAADARTSLERSLRQLKRDHIELFLLHEPDVGDLVHDDLLEFLSSQKRAGKIGNFGIGGEYSRMEAFHRERRGYTPVLQYEASVFGPNLNLPGSYRAHYRTFARAADVLGRRLAEDAALCRRWSEVVNADLSEPIVLSRLLLRASLDASPDALNLFSTRSEDHIFENAQVACDARLAEPTQRLIALIRKDDLGVGKKLYGGAN